MTPQSEGDLVRQVSRSESSDQTKHWVDRNTWVTSHTAESYSNVFKLKWAYSFVFFWSGRKQAFEVLMVSRELLALFGRVGCQKTSFWVAQSTALILEHIIFLKIIKKYRNLQKLWNFENNLLEIFMIFLKYMICLGTPLGPHTAWSKKNKTIYIVNSPGCWINF